MPLSEVREKIDHIDQLIRDLYIERMSLVDKVNEVKVQTGDAIYKPERENAMIEARSKEVAPELRNPYKALLRKLINASKEYQYAKRLDMDDKLDVEWIEEAKPFKRVATLKSQLYICDMFPKDEVKTVDTWEELMTLIETGIVDAGVGIIETIGDDVYGELYKVIAKYNLYINELKVVPDGINMRKVVVFSKDLIVKPENQFLNFMFKCEYQPGALVNTLSIIADQGIRIRKIHSLPNPDVERRYDFYVVMEANLLDKKTQAVIRQLECENQYFQMIGSY